MSAALILRYLSFDVDHSLDCFRRGHTLLRRFYRKPHPLCSAFVAPAFGSAFSRFPMVVTQGAWRSTLVNGLGPVATATTVAVVAVSKFVAVVHPFSLVDDPPLALSPWGCYPFDRL